MKKISTIFKITLGVLLVLILGLWTYVESHQPKLRGTVKLTELVKNVEVYYDSYGIPHIYANDAKDAYHAFGYVHAADRLFQMELMRRVGSGRLSEIFGPEMKKTDAFFRTLGTNRKAKADAEKFEELPDRVKIACRAYIAGINDYIAHGKIPIEYKLLRVEPEPYTIEDMYAVAGYMAYSFAYALRTDPLVEKLYQKLGYPYLKDFDMAYPKDSLWMTPDSIMSDTTFTLDDNVAAIQGLPFLDQLPVPMLQGSNNWVLGPSRTLSGKVMLANDTHIKYASPSVWYEAHIEFPGFAIYGNYLAGIPVALIGHSRNHAWGITMFEDDDSDFFKEEFLGSDSSSTISKSGSVPVEKIKETIAVKGEKDTIVTVYKTVHGPIVNSFLPVDFNVPVSMFWNYTAIENKLVQGFYQMNSAINMDSFRTGVEMVGSPGLNIAYGDAAGNIAIWSASKLYERPEGEYGKIFLSGNTEPYSNYYPFAGNPQSENPLNGYLYSANQYHKPDTGKGIAGYYAPNTRYNRIGELLKNMKPATIDSMKFLITDVHSKTAESISREIAKVIAESGQTLSDKEEEALDYLLKWDGNHRLQDQEPTIYYKVLFYTLRKAMVDEAGEDIFKSLLTTHLMMRTYPKLIFNNESKWWDNVKTTGKVEKRAQIFTEAFKKSIAELREQLGDDITEWRWQKVHSTTHEHPIGKVDLLKPFFNVGPFPSPGGVETINNSGFTLNGEGEYHANFGPAMRILIDFADVENALSILPTGNSGNPLSNHYSDQAEMYIDGDFRKMLMNKKEIVANSTLLELKP
ncbi:penicillin acylase family protein [Cryomorpha ignava]|uniref:Penicillin acylase family protein n=1 Tax=Cryomorpha ignava TaxID=101383 RepID=A0A7K3WSV0_9FLAO|nr:penicillin acylase family protein [Cryomorpha ignava]NEN24767.1 penicillin acylase family protein [Cryomorpha ignava]